MKTRRFLSLLLCTFMVVTLMPILPGATITANAASPAMALGTSGITEGNYVYYGVYKVDPDISDPVKWRVLDADEGNATGTSDSLSDGNSAVDNEDSMFLLSEYLMNSGALFDGGGTNAYQGSTLQTWVNTNFAASSSNFSTAEQGAMIATTKSDDAYTSAEGDFPYLAATDILKGDQMFLLSAEEAVSYLGDEGTNLVASFNGGDVDSWWLRSPLPDKEAATVSTAGIVNYDGIMNSTFVSSTGAVRPVFNLNRNAVFLSSVAEGGKSSGTIGADALQAVSTTTSTEKKLTLLDSNRTFKADFQESTEPASLDIPYSGATVGPNEYISAIITDSSNNIKYYGNIAKPTAATGTTTISVIKSGQLIIESVD